MAAIITLPGLFYGASPEDWDILSLIAGLIEDLLPVVSNPDATVSPASKMKGIGKTPSLYNTVRLVIGITKWTEKVTTLRDITRWRLEKDYGICIQTRRVRALDVDVPDPALSLAIRTFLADSLAALGVKAPCRSRGNSAKFLIAFEIDGGEFTKRILKVQGGMIEFLATGQQFVAVGTHESRVRYVWEDGIPTDFPVVDAAAFEHLWRGLTVAFGLEEPIELGARKKPTELRTAPSQVDPLASFLENNGWVRSFEKDGRLNITCPFEHEHTSDTAESATQYFSALTGGFQQGHFRCLHAHCAKRSDGDFINAVGYVVADFDTIPPDTIVERIPGFVRDQKGRIEATIDNCVKAVSSQVFTGHRLGFDTFRDEVMTAEKGTDDWRPFGDPDYVRMRITMERAGFKAVGRELIRDAVCLVAEEYRFDTAQLWLNGLQWDGVPRVERFFVDVFGTANTTYSRACGLYLWTALAGRVLDPGCKVDMVPVLVGHQGQGKSEAIAAIAPHPDQFIEIDLTERDDNLSRKMRGTLIGEIAELKGLQTRDQESIKAFITRRYEKWTPKFKEFATTFPRRLAMIGTTNQPEFLTDETGNRRWLPMDVTCADVKAVIRNRGQLWAEGVALWLAEGVVYREAETLARAEHDKYMLTDAWQEDISTWLEMFDDVGGEQTKRSEQHVKINELAVGALGFRAKELKKGDEMRIGKNLRALGFEKVVRRINGKNTKVYVRGGSNVP